MRMNRIAISVMALAVTVLAADTAHAKKAKADLISKSGSAVSGTVMFEDVPGGVRVRVKAKGLVPAGKHGFHIHAKGDCSSPDGKSAGGHYNPEQGPHGGPDSPAGDRHAGDLGNLTADSSGSASLDRVFKGLSVLGRKSPIAGRGVIIHAKADDLKSQPTGAAGGRIACGVIGVTKD